MLYSNDSICIVIVGGVLRVDNCYCKNVFLRLRGKKGLSLALLEGS